GEAKRLGSLEVEGQEHLRWELYRQLARRGTAQNFVDERRGARVAPAQIDPIADQSAVDHMFSIAVHGWQPFRYGGFGDLLSLAFQHGGLEDDNHLNVLVSQML